jgi:predicted transcriptional regulator
MKSTPNTPNQRAGDTVTDQDVHRVLASRTREQVLDVLGDREATSVEALAATIVARNVGLDPSAVDRTILQLYHQHLPMLADLGIVRFDPDTMQVQLVADPRSSYCD